MYDLYVIANRDTQQLRERFTPLSKYVRVQFVFDRSAAWPEHFPAALRRAQITPRTDYIFVIRGEQRLHGDPRSWLTYDIEKRSVVVWPVLIDGVRIPRSGLCLMPSDITDAFSEEWVEEADPVTKADPFPIVYAPTVPASLEAIRDLAEQMDAPYFHLVPTNLPIRLPNHPTIYPQIRSGTLPIYTQIMSVPENMHGHGYPKEFRSGTYLLPSAIADSVMPISRLLYGKNSWERGADNQLSCMILSYPRSQYDIFMLTNGETHAEEHWKMLQEKYPRAKRIDGIRGVREAHVAAAEMAASDYFWVVDADNRILPEADLDSIILPYFDFPYLFVYQARNNVNGLTYGNGGIKLFPTQTVRGMKEVSLVGGDFTATVAKRANIYSIELCWSKTIIDGTALEAYRAGFREGAKLCAIVRTETDPAIVDVARSRFRSWALAPTTGTGAWATRGVYDGHRMTLLIDRSEMNHLINNYVKIEAQFKWLRSRRDETWWVEHVTKWQKALEDETVFG